MGHPVEITDENFQKEIIESQLPAVVDFGATWCPPCRALEPIMEQLVDEFEGQVKIGAVNVDNCRNTAGKYGIMSVPTVIFFKNGQEVERMVGLSPKDVMKVKIQTMLL
ncbi:MAG TPA: thioredoxin [Candidatus Sumerlaeota bacterium]|nr:thioredoxin [Candidatus Sumerlaeota bacterium]HRR31704.1 thioredoxin [Candidatus Sumerlaeia bacterium]HON49623.1 thioredoxin [Candidatus Sumerlaeota bacterium]HOR64775.1 thioredoxin [Candidatus Sumerlaeota bacterium]HPL74214.1 thioredoxin [Candidatus Sumerlaeota bacterium]